MINPTLCLPSILSVDAINPKPARIAIMERKLIACNICVPPMIHNLLHLCSYLNHEKCLHSIRID